MRASLQYAWHAGGMYHHAYLYVSSCVSVCVNHLTDIGTKDVVSVYMASQCLLSGLVATIITGGYCIGPFPAIAIFGMFWWT